ncbi:MAG: glutamate racemase [Oceanospirillaceae bacterium]|nr:glutamate racemase [Oceanospirillaceae bacterium]
MTPSVLIFDSGVGGLSIAAEIRSLIPTLPIHYLMDDAGFPYGTCSDEWLVQRIVTLCSDAQQRLSNDILVVACNTASTLALDQLRAELSIPVVGVVPAVKTAAQLTETGEIGLLATPATVGRTYTRNLIQQFAGHCRVRLKGSSELVHWAEDYLHSHQVPAALHEHLDHWLHSPVPMSHVVLGCTHFPLLRQELETLWPDVCWIDSGAAIARRVAYCLDQRHIRIPVPDADLSGDCLWWTSEKSEQPGAENYLAQLGFVVSSGSLNRPLER